ncbi:MAG TPA: hypothetical protein VGF17_09635 [Phytomonospora sp.]
MFTTADRSALHATVAETIARSRYEAWDHHAATIAWDDLTGSCPALAGSYIEDGARDADALIPHLADLLERYGVTVEPTAEELAAADTYDDEEPSDEDLAAIEAEGIAA